MRKAILGYLVQSSIISFILAISYFVFYTYGFPQFYTPTVYALIGLLFILNVLFHSFFVHTVVKRNEAFVRRYLASTMLKLLIYLTVIIVMIVSGQTGIKIILISFLVFYIVYTVHEIYTILEFLKKNSSQNVKSK